MNTNSNWKLNAFDQQLIEMALAEDLGFPYHDTTTATLFAQVQKNSEAKILSKHADPIVICGLPLVDAILKKFSDHCEIRSHYQDGKLIAPGDTLLTLHGPPQTLLMLERTVLNFLQRLCAIATHTEKFVRAINHTPTKILDTRKTTPGFRHLEKYAVQCGGGVNHRMGLYDAMMIKDTHIDFLGGMKTALNKISNPKLLPVIVEVRTMHELEIVLNHALSKVTRVLLDNMSLPLMIECVAMCKNKISTEASGNVTLNNIVAIAECGVDFVSIGQLTHSAGSVDLSMKCVL